MPTAMNRINKEDVAVSVEALVLAGRLKFEDANALISK